MAQVVLLHGVLEATIFEVHRLSGESCCIRFCKLVDTLEDKAGLEQANSKLYVTIDLGNNTNVGRTKLVKNESSNPQWHESFRIYCAHAVPDVAFTIKLKNLIHTIDLGTARFPARKLLNGEEVDQWLHLKSHKRDTGYKIHVKLRFIDVSKDKNWSKGIISPQSIGVPYTIFPQRNGCRVTLYQDAHVPDDFITEIPLSGGKRFRPNRCWEDVFNAINNAKHLIYVAGWSVYAKITLIRDVNRSDELTLGELLIKKASQGVKVLMLVWDDRTSVPLLKKDGVLATHDEDTAGFFRNTGVHCVLCPRKPDNGQSVIQDLEAVTFSHHQKSVVVDSEIGDRVSEKRRAISSFIGGLDLCDGRYDTPFHSIFRTLGTDHRDDFHQPNFRGASIVKGGPREPWHDIHCKLEGPIAWDVLQNFEQRWKKQAGESLIPELRRLDDTTFVSSSHPMFSRSEANEAWNVQLFRSIDGGSTLGLSSGNDDHIVERSVQDAYINAIRRAKSFIYIENQYFLGSSFGWKTNKPNKPDEISASHLIPKELSLKIVSKIKAGERFVVYVVIPLWPEGVPESPSVQAILNWQKMTMEMMYKDIVEALKDKGLEANPRDYLTFFSLGNRETKNRGEYEQKEKPEHGSDYSKAQQSRRFMIYIHSKMMIVDDEYIIIGSANINQRSMDGARDTEIAMGAYQPHHISRSVGPAKGQIHGLRLSLWYEHTKMLDDAFLRPENLDCVQKLNQFADANWTLYSGETLDHDLPRHLLRYPIEVTTNGDVTTRPGAEFFPDTKARILGSKTGLPSILTS